MGVCCSLPAHPLLTLTVPREHRLLVDPLRVGAQRDVKGDRGSVLGL